MGSTALDNGIRTEWIGTVNFNLKTQFHYHSYGPRLTATNDKTFTVTRTQVSSHYVIADDGRSTNVE
jgi:N-acetylmuramoyl-L-alanine amidase